MESYPKIGSFELTPGVIGTLIATVGPALAGFFGVFNTMPVVFQCVVAGGVFVTFCVYLACRAYVLGKNKQLEQSQLFVKETK